MENEFVTFERLPNKEAAIALSKLLTENGIDNRTEDHSATFDAAFSGMGPQKEFRVKLRKEDFDKADAAIEKAVLGDVEQLQDGHYLMSFSDEELMEVVANKDEWSAFDFMFARKLLRERGKELSNETLQDLRQQRIDELSKPEKHQSEAIFMGYVLAVLGGLLGMFIGWYLSTHKKTLPNGQMVYAHSENDRRSGRIILRISIFSAIVWLLAGLSTYA